MKTQLGWTIKRKKGAHPLDVRLAKYIQQIS